MQIALTKKLADVLGKKLTPLDKASEKWGISERRIRVLCNEGRIEGATIKFGRNWSIPENANKPIDAREGNKKNYSGLEFDFSYIDSIKDYINKFRPFTKGLADSLHEKFYIRLSGRHFYMVNL